MKFVAIIRHGALDLISAAAFLVIWLLRDQFEYETLRALLLWPIVFEMYLIVALFVAGMSAGLKSTLARWVWFGAIVSFYLFGAWLTGASADTEHIWTIAFWLLLARAWPTAQCGALSSEHLRKLQLGAGYSGLLWGAGFILTMVLAIVVPPVSTEVLSDGSTRSTSPAWIFPLVWTPYFIAEAMLGAWRADRGAESMNRRRMSGSAAQRKQ